MKKYEFDAERWLRNWSARKRFLLGDGRDPFAMCADENAALRARAARLEDEIAQRQDTEASLTKWVHDLGEELDALKEAAVHIYNSGYHAGHHDTVEGRYVDIHISDMGTYHTEEVAELLAALVGEEGE